MSKTYNGDGSMFVPRPESTGTDMLMRNVIHTEEDMGAVVNSIREQAAAARSRTPAQRAAALADLAFMQEGLEYLR